MKTRNTAGITRSLASQDPTPAALRALAEAEARRRSSMVGASPPREEIGRVGPDPARYGDWENRGLASDF